MKNHCTFRVEDLGELILLMFDGRISQQERSFLQDQITTNPAALEYYHDFIITYIGLREGQVSAGTNSVAALDSADEPVLSEQVWRTLAREECTADPIIPEPRDDSEHQVVHRIEHVKIERRLKPSLSLLAASIAAVLVLVLFVQLTPVRDSHGQLTETYNAVFDGRASELQSGRYLGSEPIILRKGLARIQMDDGSSLLLEAPTELRLEADDQVFLVQGKVTVNVPPQAVGFTVRTPTATVVDYGTEFGVSCDQHAQTEAHVLKGIIEVRLGSNLRVFEKAIRLSANQAGRVSGETLALIPSNVNQFTYSFPSAFETTARSLNPLLYFRLKSENLNTFCDAAGQSNVSILPGSDRQIVPGPLPTLEQSSYALRMDGDEALEIDQVLPVFSAETGDFTEACWVRFDRIEKQIVWFNRVVNVNASGIEELYDRTLWINEHGQIEHMAYFADNPADSRRVNVIAANIELQPHQWYFVSVTHAVGKHKSLYINGQLAARSAFLQGSLLEKYSRLTFGSSVPELAPGSRGAITEILFYNRDLSDKEIRALYETVLEKP
jgi:ferric-dicitrate binding protein FerR (iron transport regulator)